MSVKLLGFAALAEIADHTAFATAIRGELMSARDLLGANMVVLSSADTETDLVFLRTCIELRIPTIVLLTDENLFTGANGTGCPDLLGHLLSVSLAKYPITGNQPHLSILEWADALLCACCDDKNEILGDALAFGIPTRKFDTRSLEANWTHQPDSGSPARHGFPTRRELLEFLDRKFQTI